jgi:hypothetical protein
MSSSGRKRLGDDDDNEYGEGTTIDKIAIQIPKPP